MIGLHTHGFDGPTTINDNHRHFYSGTTSAEPNVLNHVHTISTTTTFNDGHTHNINIITGRAIPLGNGHIHPYVGTTTFDSGHVHHIKGNTTISK